MCKSNLDAVRITPKDFTALQHEFLNNVVNGDDIYQKTTPEEWQAFEQIIKQNGPFDIVMDGLNVSYLANDQNIHRDGKFVFSKFKQKQRPCAYRVIFFLLNYGHLFEFDHLIKNHYLHFFSFFPNFSQFFSILDIFFFIFLSNFEIFSMNF